MNKKRYVIDYFLENPTDSIIDISDATGISSSTVQRYLTSSDVQIMYGIDVAEKIKEQLKINKRNGQKKGGINSYRNNQSIKNDKGQFIANEKRSEVFEFELPKVKNIRMIGKYFLLNPNKTLDELVIDFNSKYTRDYIYDCLNDDRIAQILGVNVAQSIRHQLELNVYHSMVEIRNILEFNLDDYPITNYEKEILKWRFLDTKIRSQQEVANLLGITRQAVSKVERNALCKIEEYIESNKRNAK